MLECSSVPGFLVLAEGKDGMSYFALDIVIFFIHQVKHNDR